MASTPRHTEILYAESRHEEQTCDTRPFPSTSRYEKIMDMISGYKAVTWVVGRGFHIWPLDEDRRPVLRVGGGDGSDMLTMSVEKKFTLMLDERE